jgi:SSS family solute:Na+ symporter
VVSLLTKKPDKALVDGAFACYDKEVMVHQSTSLQDDTE